MVSITTSLLNLFLCIFESNVSCSIVLNEFKSQKKANESKKKIIIKKNLQKLLRFMIDL